MKQQIKHQFYLSKTELTGIQTLIICCAIYVASPILSRHSIKRFYKNPNSTQISLTGSVADLSHPSITLQNTTQAAKSKPEQIAYVSFPFDPNSLTAENATKLGIPRKAYLNLQKYLQKAGKIKTAEQFRNIYGMEPAVYNRLESQLQIPSPLEKKSNLKPEKTEQTLTFDLNAITAKELINKLKLEYKLAYRIINYRTALGGYFDLKQILEVFGMQDSIYTRLKPQLYLQIPHQRLSLQTTAVDGLAKHPYIKYKTAKLISNFREQHGGIQHLQDLKHIITDSLQFQKLKMYFY